MSIQESNNSQRKINLGKDNNNNLMDLAFKIIEEEANKMTTEKIYHSKEKDKMKNSLLKKSKVAKEKKRMIKVRNLMDDEFMHDYNPEMQNNIINPKLHFFIDCESVSESDKDLSSASLSKDEEDQKDRNKKST